MEKGPKQNHELEKDNFYQHHDSIMDCESEDKPPIAPEGYFSITEIAESLGEKYAAISRIVYDWNYKERIGEPCQYISRNSPHRKGDHFTADQIEEIKRCLVFSRSTKERGSVPEEYLPITTIASQLNTGVETVKKILREHSEEIGAPLFNRETPYYSPEQSNLMENYYKSSELYNTAVVPEGFMSCSRIAKKLHVQPEKVAMLIQDHIDVIGEPAKYRSQPKGSVFNYYSQEQVDLIENILLGSYFTKKSPDT